MKPQQTENKKKLSTIARRIKKGLPLTGLISTLLAATGCGSQTLGIAPETVGKMAPEPNNTTEEVRKTSEMPPVPGAQPIAPESNTTEEVKKTSEIRSTPGLIALPPPAEKTEDTKK